MVSNFVAKAAVPALALILIGIGLLISPVDGLDSYSLDTMSAGKWVTVIGALAFTVSVAVTVIGFFVNRNKKSKA